MKVNSPKYTQVCRCISFALFGTLFFSFALSALAFCFGLGMQGWFFPLSVVISIFTVILCNKGNNLKFHLSWSLATLIIIASSLFLYGLVYDYSYDGVRYHQETVATLCNGWNPLLMSSDSLSPESLWSLHYAKAVEIAQASITSFTGRIEMAKGLNLMTTLAVALGLFSFLKTAPLSYFLKNNTTAHISTKKSIILTLAIISNPVVLAQQFTFYIDFYKYLYLIVILLSLSEIASGNHNQRISGGILLVMGLVLAMGTKFNFFFEVGLLMIFVLIWLTYKKDYAILKKVFFISLSAFLIGIILCRHPYINNLSGWGHPLYPLMGTGAVDIMDKNTPDIFLHSNRFCNFFKSLFSISLPTYDQRMGGFTILMPVILAISGFVWWKMRRKMTDLVNYILILTIASCFLFAQTWWARYISQLWLVGAILLVIAFGSDMKKVGRVLALLMIITGAATFCVSVGTAVVRSVYYNALFKECRTQKVVLIGDLPPQIKRHFDEKGVDYVICGPVHTEKYSGGLYYYPEFTPIIILSEDRIERIDSELKKMHQSIERYLYNND